MAKDRPRYYKRDKLRVLYSANHEHLVGKTVTVVGMGIWNCNDFWYKCECEGNEYSLCESQLTRN